LRRIPKKDAKTIDWKNWATRTRSTAEMGRKNEITSWLSDCLWKLQNTLYSWWS